MKIAMQMIGSLLLASTALAASPGDIIITEILQNPNAVSDSLGEWFEVFNPTESAIDMFGWVVKDDGTDSFTIAASVLVQPGGYAVLGNNADTTTNGGVTLNYVYPQPFFLGNSADELVLEESGVEIDRVNWDGGPNFPDPTGATMALIDASMDNNVGSNWCESSSATFGAGDFGTPGAANDCGTAPPPPPAPSPINVIVTEIMQNPSALSDSSGEYIELYNAEASPVDIDGWTIKDNDSDSFVINNGGPLTIPAGGYLVLGNSAQSYVDYVYSGLFLSNSADEVVVLDTTMAEVDRVEYDGGPNFPDPTGASMSLKFADLIAVPYADGSMGSNWCTSFQSQFSTGDFGTPGAENDCPTLQIVSIMEIQGDDEAVPGSATLRSPLEGFPVQTTGVVTAVDSNLFYLQDPDGDDNDMTSDAIIVFTGSSPTVSVGDLIQVTGDVSEFFPGGSSTGNQPTTQIVSPEITVLSTGNPLPAPIKLGMMGRPLPTEDMIDALNFWESLEAMRVTCVACMSIAPTNRFGEIFAVTDYGNGATGTNSFGGLTITPSDFNPEKVQLQEDSGIFSFDIPEVDSGEVVGDVTGVVGYGFGNYEIYVTEAIAPATAIATVMSGFGIGFDFSLPTFDYTIPSLPGSVDDLTVASYNVLNLDPNDSDGDQDVANGRFSAIAGQIVNDLGSPDIVALQEIQDNTGSANDGVTAADVTLQTLVDAIAGAGGPTYAFLDNTFITDNASGGQPGANIRTAYLYNPTRVSVVPGSVGTIGGQGSGEAFEGARLPLVATFEYEDEEFVIVNCHLSSKGGSAPIVGTSQSFEDLQEDTSVNGSLDERQAQSAAIAAYVSGLSNENVIVLGDMNEFQFVSPLLTLEGAGLTNLWDTFDDELEIWSFEFQGNSQALDHILVSDALADDSTLQVFHLNSMKYFDNAARPSDHDPLLLTIDDAFFGGFPIFGGGGGGFGGLFDFFAKWKKFFGFGHGY